MSSGDKKLRRTTTKARISTRFGRLSPKYKALGLAMSRYADGDGRFDQDLFTEGFEDADPQAIADMRSLTGLFEDLLNNFSEMLLTAARARQLAICADGYKPEVPRLVDAIRADGGFTPAQTDVLKDLNWVRNQFQHSSPTITSEEAYQGILRLRQSYRALIQSFVDWLKTNGLDHLLSQ